MQNRKTLESKSRFSLVQVDEVDENGNIVSTYYEIVAPDGNIIKQLESLTEAQKLLETILQQNPKPQKAYRPRM